MRAKGRGYTMAAHEGERPHPNPPPEGEGTNERPCSWVGLDFQISNPAHIIETCNLRLGCCLNGGSTAIQGTFVAILTIRLVPDPILFRKARKVAKITAQHRKLADDMIETMTEHHGVGLAANQVGVLERICVIQTPDMEEAMILVNPEIVRAEGLRELEEGCLSVPGYRGMVVRSERVRARALGLNSKSFKVDAEELLAQALEHEIDHLNGIMYMDHLVAHTTLYKIVEQPDGSEEDAKFEADGDGHDHGHHHAHDPEFEADGDGHDHGHHRVHDPEFEADGDGHDHGHHHAHHTEFDALHRQLHEMRGEAGDSADPDAVETTAP